MKVAILATPWASAATAESVAQWCDAAWKAAAPHSDVAARAIPAIGPRMADGLNPQWMSVGGVVGTPTEAGFVLAPHNGAARFNPQDLATGLLGLAASAVQGEFSSHVIIPVGDEHPAGDATQLWGGGLEAMRAAVTPLAMVALVSDSRPLLGLSGMSAAVMTGRESDSAVAVAAQEQERRWSDVARGADASVTSLMGGRLSDTPGSGAAGGLAYCLAAVGARLQPGAAFIGDALAAHVLDHADLVVVATPTLDARECDHGLVRFTADHAGRRAVPCIVIAHDVMVGRRDLMAAGLSAAYECEPTQASITDEVSRVAVSWTRA